MTQTLRGAKRPMALLLVLLTFAALMLSACGDSTTAAPVAGTTAAGAASPAATTAMAMSPGASMTTAAGGGAMTTAAANATTAAGATGAIPTSGGYLDTIKQRGKLIVGVKFDQPGFGLNDPISKKITGFDADFGREFAKQLLGSPDKVEFVEAKSANRIPFLQNDNVDVVIATMTITDERKQQIDFSDVYYIAGQSLLVKKGSAIKSISDLNGKTVATVKGSTSLKNIEAKSTGAKVITFDAYAECVTALDNGQADAVTTDDVILIGFKAQSPDKYDVVGGQFTQEPYGMGVKKGRTELLNFVNGTLKAMKADGRWKAVYDANVKPASGQSVEPPK